MIFVTVGTARQPFDRLIDAVEDALAGCRAAGSDLVVQHGCSRAPKVGGAHAFLRREEHERLLRDAAIVVSHAGAGTIIACLRQGKRAVVMARRDDLGEQVNDHQVELAERLARQGLVFVAHDASDLVAHLRRPQTDFVIEPPPRNTAAVDRVKRFLDEVERQRGADFHYDRHPFGFVDLRDTHALGASHPQLLRDAVLSLPAGGLLLDVGSGPGRLAVWAASNGKRVIALDRSLRSLRALKSAAATLPAVAGDALALPFAATAALVVLDGVAHHTADPARAVSCAAGAAVPGGRVYVAVYKRWTHYHLAYSTLGRILRWCNARSGLGWAVRGGRSLYGGLHRMRRGRKEPAFIDSLFADYFLTPRASFHSRSEVEKWAAAAGLQRVAYDRFPSGNCHLFVFRRAR